MSDIVYSDGDYLECPYCGSRIPVDFETFSDRQAQTEEEIYCEDCDHEFIAYREIEFHYSTEKKE